MVQDGPAAAAAAAAAASARGAGGGGGRKGGKKGGDGELDVLRSVVGNELEVVDEDGPAVAVADYAGGAQVRPMPCTRGGSAGTHWLTNRRQGVRHKLHSRVPIGGQSQRAVGTELASSAMGME